MKAVCRQAGMRRRMVGKGESWDACLLAEQGKGVLAHTDGGPRAWDANDT